MVELLVTISIIFFLFGMLAIAAGPMRERAKRKNTEAKIETIGVFLATYHSKTGSYPSDGIDKRVETDEGTRLESGAALTFALLQPLMLRKKQPDGTMKMIGEEEPVGDFKDSELSPPYEDDPDARELLDGFFEPFHYDRLTGGRDAFSRQGEGEVHLGWDDEEKEHHGDPRDEKGVAVETAGPQNVNQYDLWSHGLNGHTGDELPTDVIANWQLPGVSGKKKE